jgi:hypothetical protein
MKAKPIKSNSVLVRMRSRIHRYVAESPQNLTHFSKLNIDIPWMLGGYDLHSSCLQLTKK